MNLTPEQEELGRRNFLKAVAGVPALAALGTAAAVKGPVRGGPVRLGYVGLGVQGRNLLAHTNPAYAEVVALCDINPGQLAKADDTLAQRELPPARHYSEWKDMLQGERLEAVAIAAPLWAHADITVGCLEAGKHVLCEKMMGWDLEGCRRMRAAADRSGKILEIGYQRFYNPLYQAAHEGVVRAGLLGDVYHARLVWHRNGNWKRKGDPPSPDYDASRWGYPTWDHLLNWRLYWRYSKGLMAELGSHVVNNTNWFFDSHPEAVSGSGGLYRFKEGREVQDHVYVTFEYPGGRTAVFTSIESNAWDDYYELHMGTRGTLLLRAEREAFFFTEGDAGRSTGIEIARKAGPVAEASGSRPSDSAGRTKGSSVGGASGAVSAYEVEVSGFCSAIRTGAALRSGPDRAIRSAQACILANEAMQSRSRILIPRSVS
jgi:predicted dehydrogenase